MRAIVFCLSAPYPVDTGTRLRANSVIKALQNLGYSVTTVSPRDTGDSDEWITEKLELAEAISLEPPPRNLLVRTIDKIRRKTGLFERYTRSPLSPERRERLKSLSSLEPFDVLVTEYAPNTVISNLIPAKLRLLDTCDLMSIHNRKVAAARSLYLRFRPKRNAEFIALKTQEVHPHLDPREIEDFKGYDSVIAIAADEEKMIESLKLGNHTSFIGPCVNVDRTCENDYTGDPVFPYSNNIFNVQGLLHFIHQIAPLVLAAVPDFRMTVTGIPVKQACGFPFINYTGHVDSIQSVYSKSGFAIIGAYDGTGQQLKVVEVMASRLAVIGYRRRIDEYIVTAGSEGLLADNEHDFAAAVIRLWNDRREAASMGANALEKASASFSQQNFTKALKDVIASASQRQNRALSCE